MRNTFVGLIKSSPASSSSFPRSGQIPVSSTWGTTPSSLGSCEKPRGHTIWMMETSAVFSPWWPQPPEQSCVRLAWSIRRQGAPLGTFLCPGQGGPGDHTSGSQMQSLVFSSTHLRSLPPPISLVPASPGPPPSPQPSCPHSLGESDLLPSNYHFLSLFFNWRIIALQWCVSFFCTA